MSRSGHSPQTPQEAALGQPGPGPRGRVLFLDIPGITSVSLLYPVDGGAEELAARALCLPHQSSSSSMGGHEGSWSAAFALGRLDNRLVVLTMEGLPSQQLRALASRLCGDSDGRGDTVSGTSSVKEDEEAAHPIDDFTTSQVVSADITLELLVAKAPPARAVHHGSRSWPYPPVEVTVCRERDLQPVPGVAPQPPAEPCTTACAGDDAADAALMLAVEEAVSSGGGPPRLLCVGRSHALSRRTGLESGSTWALASVASSDDGALLPEAGAAPAPDQKALLACLAECTNTGGQQGPGTILVVPCPSALGSPLPLAAVVGPLPHRVRAALAAIHAMVPLDRCLVTLHGAVEGGGRVACNHLHVTPFVEFTDFEDNGPLLRRLAAVALASGGPSTPARDGPRVSGLSALLDERLRRRLPATSESLVDARGGAFSAPVTIDGLVDLLAAAGAAGGTLADLVRLFMAAAALATTARGVGAAATAPWYHAEAEGLLGMRIASDETAAATAAVCDCFVRAVANIANNGAASALVAGALFVQLPRPAPAEEGPRATRGWLRLSVDALHARAAGSAVARRLADSLVREAALEGAWDGSVAESFAAVGHRPSVLPEVWNLFARTAAQAAEFDLSEEDALRRYCAACVASFSRSEVRLSSRSLKVRLCDGCVQTYSLQRVFAALPLERSMNLLTKQAAPGTNGLLRQWLQTRGATGGMPPRPTDAALSLGGPVHTVCEVQWPRRGTFGDKRKTLSVSGLFESFRLGSQAYVHCLPLPSLCLELLSPAVRGYCCCYCRSPATSGGGGEVDSVSGNTPPETAGLAPAFAAPQSHRRSLYVRFVQLLAAARYREACLLCRDAVPFASRIAVGATEAFLRQEDLNALVTAGAEAVHGAARLLQRVGRGAAARRWDCAPRLVSLAAEHRRAFVAAAFAAHPSDFENRYRQQGGLVEQAARGAAASTRSAARQLSEAAAGPCQQWAKSVSIAKGELAAAAAEAASFEESRRVAEADARALVRQYRELLTAAWRRQTGQLARRRRAVEGGGDSLPPPLLRDAAAFRRQAHRDARLAQGLGPLCERQRAGLERRSAARLTVVVKGTLATVQALRDRAEAVVEAALQWHRQRAGSVDRAAAVAGHLAAQQSRFRDYASRREERTLVGGGASSLLGGYDAPSDGLITSHHQHGPVEDDTTVFESERDKLSLWEED